MSFRFISVLIVLWLTLATNVQTDAQTPDSSFVNGDLLPNSPELAARGSYTDLTYFNLACLAATRHCS